MRIAAGSLHLNLNVAFRPSRVSTRTLSSMNDSFLLVDELAGLLSEIGGHDGSKVLAPSWIPWLKMVMSSTEKMEEAAVDESEHVVVWTVADLLIKVEDSTES